MGFIKKIEQDDMWKEYLREAYVFYKRDGLEEDMLRAKIFRYANAMWRYRTCALRLAYMKAKRTIKLL